MFNKYTLGKSGEAEAVSFLKGSGYRILAKNYRSKLGEVDIVAKDKETVCFIEVKTRYSDKFGLPQEAISDYKQRQIAKTALIFLKERKLFEKSARFDVVSILYSRGTPKIDLIKNAFELNSNLGY